MGHAISFQGRMLVSVSSNIAPDNKIHVTCWCFTPELCVVPSDSLNFQNARRFFVMNDILFKEVYISFCLGFFKTCFCSCLSCFSPSFLKTVLRLLVLVALFASVSVNLLFGLFERVVMLCGCMGN